MNAWPLARSEAPPIPLASLADRADEGGGQREGLLLAQDPARVLFAVVTLIPDAQQQGRRRASRLRPRDVRAFEAIAREGSVRPDPLDTLRAARAVPCRQDRAVPVHAQLDVLARTHAERCHRGRPRERADVQAIVGSDRRPAPAILAHLDEVGPRLVDVDGRPRIHAPEARVSDFDHRAPFAVENAQARIDLRVSEAHRQHLGAQTHRPRHVDAVDVDIAGQETALDDAFELEWLGLREAVVVLGFAHAAPGIDPKELDAREPGVGV